MIEVEINNGIGRITLNRPAVHNSLDRQAMADLRATLSDWASSDIRVLVLTGTGKSFCSGVSLSDVANEDWASNPLTAVCDALEEFHCPTICALNGGVYGGGVELALSCDFRVGVSGMKMFVPASKIGVHYDQSGIGRFVQKLGPQAARKIFLLAERFEDHAMRDIRFLDYLVSPDELEAQVNELTENITNSAPLAVQGMKRTILEISRNNLDADAAKQRIAECFTSEDHREGMAALSEKRKPIFIGK